MFLFQDKLLERIKSQIDIDQKYLFYPTYAKEKNNLHQYFSFLFPKKGDICYFSTTNDWLSSLIKELKNAKKFIFLQFFSISSGIMWERIVNVLQKKVQEGVEVRIIYDNLISALKLPLNFCEQLQKVGILCQPFYQKNRWLGMINNHHLHRKVVIIDGYIAFTGGMNIGDEYLNLIHPYGFWQDVGISLTTSDVWSFTVMFLSIWTVLTTDKENYWNYYESNTKERDPSSFCVYGDNPLKKERLSEKIICSLIHLSSSSITFCTPYFIPTIPLLKSIISAKKRKIKMNLIIPGIPDKKIIYFLTKLFAFLLKGNNFNIYIYKKGFNHGKLILIDEEIASIGSINLDYYSLHYNFEYNILIEDKKIIAEIKKDLERIKADSTLIH